MGKSAIVDVQSPADTLRAALRLGAARFGGFRYPDTGGLVDGESGRPNALVWFIGESRFEVSPRDMKDVRRDRLLSDTIDTLIDNMRKYNRGPASW